MADELISREALIKQLELLAKCEDSFRQSVILGVVHTIKCAPSVDAVEVVRCENCDWYREDGSICVNAKCTKSYYGCRVPKQHFCSYGERKEDNATD